MSRNTNIRTRSLALFIAFLSLLTVFSPVLSGQNDEGGLLPQADRKPNPDPSTLTTQQSQREIAGLKEIIFTRLDAMDKAIKLLQDRADRTPSEADGKIQALKELMLERFKGFQIQFDGIQLQFKERDTRVEQAAGTQKTALDSTLQAQKESAEKQNLSFSQATQKQEMAFIKQIDSLSELLRSAIKSLEDKIQAGEKVSNDKIAIVSSRVGAIENVAQGQSLAKTDQGKDTTLIISLVALVLTIIGVSTAVIVANRRPPVH